MSELGDKLGYDADLFQILYGLTKWDGTLVAERLRSKDLCDTDRAIALSLLADLIDGTGLAGKRRLKLTGDSKHFHVTDARREYDRIMQIGGWVQSEIDRGETFRSALAGAEDEFTVSEKTAQRALAIYRERIERAEETGLWFPVKPVRKR